MRESLFVSQVSSPKQPLLILETKYLFLNHRFLSFLCQEVHVPLCTFHISSIIGANSYSRLQGLSFRLKAPK